MTDRVWISGVFNSRGFKDSNCGLRVKFYDCEWEPASLESASAPDYVFKAFMRNHEGYPLKRREFPEAAAIFDEKAFSEILDIFYYGPFLAVKGKLAKTLLRFDLGDGGLVLCPIFQADLISSVEEDFYCINFGARKNSLVIRQSENVVIAAKNVTTGVQYWRINSWREDGDIVVSPAALVGPDLWFEEGFRDQVFMKDALAQALIEIGMKEAFALKECRVVGGAL